MNELVKYASKKTISSESKWKQFSETNSYIDRMNEVLDWLAEIMEGNYGQTKREPAG